METTVITLTGNFAVKPKSAFAQLVEQLFAENAKTIGNQGTLASVIGTCFASMSQTQHLWKRETFRDLLLHLEAQGCYALLREAECINALANMAAFGNKMAQKIHTWSKESIVVEAQMSSLIRHCFAHYDVPEFLESAFYEESKIHMFWYVQLARGESVLALKGFPVKFTRKMAHEFQNAPSHYNIAKAIRWAQAKGFGASADMAEIVAWSTLSEYFEYEEFWETVIMFLVKQETLPYNEVQEVLFYIQNQFEANKKYTMKGRNWNTLLKQSNEWHVEYAKRMEALNRADWVPSGISSFSKVTVDNAEAIGYNIIELVSSEALYEEGYEMSHCVAEYEYDCAQGASAIFSLRKKTAEITEILATIEVDLERKAIVQAKAKYNECISLEAGKILHQWAEKEKLALDYDEYYEPENEVYIPQPAPAAVREYREVRRYNTDNDNWRWIFYIIFALVKLCVLFSK